ncbi:MAG: hypothetical protein ABIF77_05650, partial [bacterium]
MTILSTTGQHCPVTRCVAGFLALLLASQSLLAGCSSSTNPQPEPEPEPQSQPVDGNVDTNEIGGSELKIISAWADEVSVGGGGDFTVDVSKSGTQLLFAVDNVDSLRALCLSIPTPAAKDSTGLLVNASSTAMSLVMMTPGVLVLDPAAAAVRTEEIRALAEFTTLTDLLSAWLTTQCLSTALADQDVAAALDACVTAWVETDGEPGPMRYKSEPVPPDFDGCPNFWAQVTDQEARSYVEITLANQSWRYVTIFRRLLDEHSTPVNPGTHEYFDAPMPGATPVGWLCLFQGDCGQPTNWTDHVDFTCLSRVASAEYYVHGWGGQAGIDLPAGMTESEEKRRDRVVVSTLDYLVLPVLGLFTGIIPSNTDLYQIAHLIQDTPGLSANVAAIIIRMFEASSPAEFGGEMLVLMRILAGFVLFNSTVWAWLGFPMALIPFLGAISLLFNAAFTYTNLAMVLVSWALVPQTCKVVVSSPWADEPCDDVIPPDAVTDLRVV